MTRIRRLLVVAGAASATVVATHAAPPSPGPPLLGANLVYASQRPPQCAGPQLLMVYDQPGVRRRMALSLAAMRAAGIETLRLFVFHSHAPPTLGSAIPSPGGRLPEPYRGNLVALLHDIRGAGFRQVSVTFVPWGANDPIGYTAIPYDPALFAENWAVIRTVRGIVKAAGLPVSHFDLLNEGAPADSQVARLGRYLTSLYREYVRAFGNRDVTVSAIAKGAESGRMTEDRDRIQNLIDALRASGEPLPRWFEIHPSWGSGARADLEAVDRVLAANGLTQPIVVGEEAYENVPAARAVAAFTQTSSRRVLELLEWPAHASSRSGGRPPACVQLPFGIEAYADALRGPAGPTTLEASVAPSRLTLLTTFGRRVVALEAGRYVIAVSDSSSHDGFRLVGPGVDRRSGIRFRGFVSWRLTLRPGRYVFAAEGSHHVALRSFSVLAPG